MPKTMQAKLEVFLRSLVGRDLSQHEYDNYEFTQQDIIQLCRSALHVLGKRDDFFEELSLNFAKFIYLMIDRKWSDTSPIKLLQLANSFKRANDNDKKILFLVYGSISIMSVQKKKSSLSNFIHKLNIEKSTESLAQRMRQQLGLN